MENQKQSCLGVDVAKNSLGVSVSTSEGVRRFANGREDATNAVHYIRLQLVPPGD